MSGRLPTGLVVGALIRRVHDAGGFAVVLAKGHAEAGGILIRLVHRDAPARLVERGIGPEGRTMLVDTTPTSDIDGYWLRRRQRDPDLWVIELDIADAERFAAETILDN